MHDFPHFMVKNLPYLANNIEGALCKVLFIMFIYIFAVIVLMFTFAENVNRRCAVETVLMIDFNKCWGSCQTANPCQHIIKALFFFHLMTLCYNAFCIFYYYKYSLQPLQFARSSVCDYNSSAI